MTSNKLLTILACMLALLYTINPKMTYPINTYTLTNDTLMQNLSCLQDSSYLDQVFLQYRLFDYPSNPDLKAIQQQLKVLPHIFLVYLLDQSLSISANAVKVAQYLNTLPAKMVWFRPTFTALVGHSCDQMFEFATVLQKNLNKPVGIHDAEDAWRIRFDSAQACPEFGIFPLLWFNFHPFEPFSGWTSYQLRMNTQPLYICNWTVIQILTPKSHEPNSKQQNHQSLQLLHD